MYKLLDNYNNYIFDMDGTIVNSFNEVISALEKACIKMNAEYLPEKLTTNLIGPPMKEIIKAVLKDAKNEELIEKVANEYTNIYDNNQLDSSQAYPGVKQWLTKLHKEGKRLFIATNKPQIPTYRLVRKLNINFFTDIYTIDKYEFKNINKAQMIKEIIEKYSCEISSTLMIGDTVGDMTAAKENMVKSIGVLWGYGEDKIPLKAIADYVMSTKDLLKISTN